MVEKETIRQVLDNTDNTLGKVFTFCIQFLIIVSLVTFSMDTLPDLSPTKKEYLRLIEVITVVIFSLEYALRLIVAEKVFKFVFSFYGLVDLIAILPFYFVSGLDLRAVRVSVATSAWTVSRNQAGGTVNWRFTTEDARIKLKQLYPINVVVN